MRWQEQHTVRSDGANKPDPLRAPQSWMPRIAKDTGKFNVALIRPGRCVWLANAEGFLPVMVLQELAHIADVHPLA
jgi:hypothetical protein